MSTIDSLSFRILYKSKAIQSIRVVYISTEATMKVGELIKLLKKHPKDVHVIMTVDSEGNEYKDIHFVDKEVSFWEGKQRFLDQACDKDYEPYTEETLPKDSKARKCIVIQPY